MVIHIGICLTMMACLLDYVGVTKSTVNNIEIC